MGDAKMRLTTRELNVLSEIQTGRRVTDIQLNHALNRDANERNSLEKAERKLWEEMAEARGLDLDTKTYWTIFEDGFWTIVEKDGGNG